MSLSENIRAAQLQAGLLQEQVAEALEVSRQAVSRWERRAAFYGAPGRESAFSERRAGQPTTGRWRAFKSI